MKKLLCLFKKINRPKKSGQGVDKSYLLDDSVAFGISLFYNQQLPDHSQGHYGAKHRNIFLTMLAHRTDMGLSQPRTQSLGFVKNSNMFFRKYQ